MIYNIIGLSFDLIGVLLLFRFGILPNNLWDHLIVENGMSEKDEKNHKKWSKIAITLIFIGFALQLTGAVVKNSYSGFKKEGNTIELNQEKNITSGLVGNLKLKQYDDRLSYQLELKGNKKSYNDISKFWINLEDKEGFKIYEIEENFDSKNSNISRLEKNDSLFLTVKNSISFPDQDYKGIENWNLQISK